MLIKHSNTSNIIRFTLKNSSTGIGLTGLTNASAGLIIATICNNEATTTTYTQAAGNIETIAALGTYAAPTASKCRFKEVDATNHKGLYEFQFTNARFAIASARSLVISVTGATSLLDVDYEIQLVSFDPHDSVRMGMTALPNAAADGAGGLPISDAGGLDLDTKLANAHEITAARMGVLTDWIDGGRLDLLLDAIPTTAMRGTDNAALASGVDLTHIMGTILTEGIAGRLAAAFIKLLDVATPLLVASDVMRGTDSANTVVPDAAGVAPTVSEIQTEMEENGASLLDTIRDELANATDGLGALKALIDTNKTELDGLQGTDGKCLISTDAQDLSGTLDVNTKTITAGIIAMATLATDIGSTAYGTNKIALACRKVLDEIKLDHLVAVADNDDPVNNSIIAKLVSSAATADWSTFVNTSDALQALRDRGDAAWITGGGGSISDILNVQPLIPNAIDLANTATVRIGLGLTNMLDDMPSTAEITPGTITIDRKAIGGTSWTNIVNAAACSELAGLIYYDEVFDSGTGYVAGDTIRITFKSQKIVVAANDYEITGTDGWVFHTYVREAMRGTNSAYTGTPPTVDEIQTEMEENGASLLDTIRDDLANGTDGLGALKTLIDTVNTDLSNGTDGLGALKALIDTIDSIADRILDATEIRRAAVVDVAATTTKFDTNLIEATNDYWNRMAILFTSGQNDGQMRRIKDYDGAAKEITLQTPLSFAPANADTFIICTVRAFITPDIADIADAILDELTAGHTIAGSLSKAISDTLADTNELQTNQGNWATATGFSTHNAAAVKTAIEAAGSSIAQILADSNELQTDWVNGGRLDLLIDAIKVVTDALTSAAATKLALSAGTIVAGTVSHDNIAASTTVFYCDDITEATADHFNGRIVIFTSGALQYQATDISDYALVAGEGKFTVTALTEAPADNVTFIIV